MRRYVMLSMAVFSTLLAIRVQSQTLANDTAQATHVNPFGIVEGFWFPEVTCDLRVGWERIIFNWEQHQPTGPEDWHTLNVDDRWLKSAADCDREVVALLKHTPAWATDSEPGPGVPRGLYLPFDDPGNSWGRFVYRAVEYYASRGVTHYIIWNEPDIQEGVYGYEFAGDLEDYFRMLKVAYLAAKTANSTASIHIAGKTYWHDVNEGRRPYLERLLERIVSDPQASEHGFYFDVLSLHIYFRSETVYDIIHEARRTMDQLGLTDKRIWINEMNAAPTIDPAWPVERPVFDLDLLQQADYLIQGAALALAAGAERLAAYKLYDQQLAPGAESFGLLSPPDASPRPAYYAWQTLSSYWNDVESAERSNSSSVDAVLMEHQDGRQTLVAWAREAQDVTLHLEGDFVAIHTVDREGKMAVVQPVDGVYIFTLPAARCTETDGCFIGGKPLILNIPPGDWTATHTTGTNTITLDFD